MRHRIKKRHFNRDTNHRKALLRNLVRSLVEQGHIVTTKAKAKETKRLSDKLIYKAAKADLTSRRVLHRFFGKRDIVNTLVDRVAPVMKDRNSGFTRIVVLGKRKGDNSEMVRLELVNKPEKLGTLKSGKDHSKVKPKTKAKKASSVKKTASKKVATEKASLKKTSKTKAKLNLKAVSKK